MLKCNIIRYFFFISNITFFSLCYSEVNFINEKSIYIGFGNGTNIGGVIGVGTEVKVHDRLSFNLAVGSIHPVFEEKVDKSKFDYDLGIKFYLLKYLFIGLNYGFIDYEYISIYDTTGLISDENKYSYNEIRGFSFTLGARTPSYKDLYMSAYIGTTSERKANCSDADGFLNETVCTPRMGVMLGYELQ